MPFITLGLPNHDTLPGVSANDHHTATVAIDLNHQDLANRGVADHHAATVAGDLNLANMAERLHASLTSVGVNDHLVNPSQVAMEGESDVNRALNPARVRFSPGVAKAHCKADAAGTIDSSYNISGITDIATGQIRFTILDDFSSTNYVCVIGFIHSLGLFANAPARTAGSIDWDSRITDGTLTDPGAWMMAAFGDQ